MVRHGRRPAPLASSLSDSSRSSGRSSSIPSPDPASQFPARSTCRDEHTPPAKPGTPAAGTPAPSPAATAPPTACSPAGPAAPGGTVRVHPPRSDRAPRRGLTDSTRGAVPGSEAGTAVMSRVFEPDSLIGPGTIRTRITTRTSARRIAEMMKSGTTAGTPAAQRGTIPGKRDCRRRTPRDLPAADECLYIPNPMTHHNSRGTGHVGVSDHHHRRTA